MREVLVIAVGLVALGLALFVFLRRGDEDREATGHETLATEDDVGPIADASRDPAVRESAESELQTTDPTIEVAPATPEPDRPAPTPEPVEPSRERPEAPPRAPAQTPTPPVDAGRSGPPPAETAVGAAPSDPTYEQRQAIQASFRDARTDFRDCYEQALALDPELSDRLVIELSVAPDPDDFETTVVELVAITSEEMAIDEVTCFAEIAEALAMPLSATGEPYTLRYPLLLTTTGSGDAPMDAGLQ